MMTHEDLIEVVKPYTMASPGRIRLLIDLARCVNEKGIPGDMVECGVCNGGTSAILAHFAALSGRKAWLFDSFRGMPGVTKDDNGLSLDGMQAVTCVGKYVGDIEKVRRVIALAGGNLSQVEIVEGWFHETFPTVSVPQIAMLSLDSDWYESEKMCLDKFYENVSPGGFIYFDDFYYWPGCRKAAMEYFEANKIIPAFNQVEHSMWIQASQPKRDEMITETPLCRLAAKWRTDKTVSVRHDYTPYYHKLLEGRDIRKVLEIGIGYPSTMAPIDYITGASLFMWEEYFPGAEIYGLDVRPDILVNEGRIKSFQCDQGSEESLREAARKLGNGFDLVIDDGSHQVEHQVLSARTLIPLVLKPNGLYIIEDVFFPEKITSQLPYRCEVKEFGIKYVKDDRLVVINGWTP